MTERDADGDGHQEADARHDQGGDLSVGPELLDDELGGHLDEGHDGGDGGDDHHDEEGKAHDLAHEAHGVKDLGQDDEDEGDAPAAVEQAGVKVGHGGEDGQARQQGHHRVKEADHHRGVHDVDALAGVGAVGDHDAHAQGQGEEGLAHGRQHALEGDDGEVRLQVESETLADALAQGQRVDGDAHHDEEEDGHQHLGHPLDALLHAAGDDDGGDGHEDGGVEDDLPGVDGEAGQDPGVPGEGVHGKLGGPAAQHRVVAGDEGGDQDGDQTAPAQVPADLLIGGDGVRRGPAAQVDLAEHRYKADEDDAGYIQQNEGGAAVLRGLIGEGPNVAEAHGAARRRQDEAQAAGEAHCLFRFHRDTPFFRFFLSNPFYLRRNYLRKGSINLPLQCVKRRIIMYP